VAAYLDNFLGKLNPEVLNQLSSALNIDENVVSQIIPEVTALILEGLKKQKDDFGGQERVDHILDKYGSADALSNIGQLFERKKYDNRIDASLGGLLGHSGYDATNSISKNFDLDSNIASKIIPMLAPVILGVLTNKRDSKDIGSSGISALLEQNWNGGFFDFIEGIILGDSPKTAGEFLGGLSGVKSILNLLNIITAKLKKFIITLQEKYHTVIELAHKYCTQNPNLKYPNITKRI
jgi:hypothetical protein